MCGRYGHYRAKQDYEAALEKAGGLTVDRAQSLHDIPPNYNVSPTQSVWVAKQRDGNVWLDHVNWGLVPSWSKDPEQGPHPINARAESVGTSKLFAPLLRKKRCLVPCDGFYEWKQTPSGKQPYLIRLKSGEPFFFAGLYDIWHDDQPDRLPTFTIITCEPNEVTSQIHNRMPVIAKPEDYARWLDSKLTDAKAVVDILKPYPPDEMVAYPISRRVNSPRNNDAAILEPVNDA